MAKGTRILLCTVLVLARSHELAHAQSLNLSVLLRNDARVPADTLDAARQIVSHTYSQAGIALAWSDDDRAQLTVILRPRASKETAQRAQDAMGYTPGGGDERGRLAFVMMNRVNEMASGYGAASSVVLGAAIAHELGHLLLGKEHTATGLMKRYLNQADFRKARNGELTFTEEQTKRLRERGKL